MVSHLTRIEYYCLSDWTITTVMVSHLTQIEYLLFIRLTITTVMVSHLTRIESSVLIRLDHHYGDGQSLNTDRVLLFYQTGPSLR